MLGKNSFHGLHYHALLRSIALFPISHRPRVADFPEVQSGTDDDLPLPISNLDGTKIADYQPLDRLPNTTAIQHRLQ